MAPKQYGQSSLDAVAVEFDLVNLAITFRHDLAQGRTMNRGIVAAATAIVSTTFHPSLSLPVSRVHLNCGLNQ